MASGHGSAAQRGLSLRALRGALVEGPDSVGTRARAARWALLSGAFPALSDMRVLDLGGTVDAWERAPTQPGHVTVVNLVASELPTSPPVWVTTVVGDACDPPSDVSRGSYDLVYSNSLLEHVGGFGRRAELAQVIRSLAPRYWVQTPYRYFPIEPHWLFPGFQFLPVNVRASISLWWPLQHTRSTSREDALLAVLYTELVGKTEMELLFPDSELFTERFAGFGKSLIAVKRG